jgi:hypothetical protein
VGAWYQSRVWGGWGARGNGWVERRYGKYGRYERYEKYKKYKRYYR